MAFTDLYEKNLQVVKDQVWLLYEGLKKYKLNPRAKDKIRLEKMFDNIFFRKTASATLNAALKRFYQNKSGKFILSLTYNNIAAMGLLG